MRTKIRTQEGEIFDWVTKQYQVGMYYIVNGDASRQGGFDIQENAFHTMIRRNALKKGDTIVDGSIIETKIQKLNKFEKDWLEENSIKHEKKVLDEIKNDKIKQKIKQKIN